MITDFANIVMYILWRKPVFQLNSLEANKKCDGFDVFPSSCLALNDLIRGRQADDLIEHLREIWETLFRVLDDIKVSVPKISVRVG